MLLPDQDRSRWDADAIAEGERLVARGWRLGRLGPYLIQASIAVEHSRGSDWNRIVWLYDQLQRRLADADRRPQPRRRRSPSATAPRRAWREMAGLDLDGYHLFHAARADLLRRLDRRAEAADAYLKALSLTDSEVERDFLARETAQHKADCPFRLCGVADALDR